MKTLSAIVLSCLVMLGCTGIVHPSSEIKTVLRAGCDLDSYHHNASRQEIDIKCK